MSGKAAIIPRFEFGFGLSYTTFQYSGLTIVGSTAGGSAPVGPGSSLDPWYEILDLMKNLASSQIRYRLHDKVVTVGFSVKNTGAIAGHEVCTIILLYVQFL